MIASISGKKASIGENCIVVENHGIGYKVFVTSYTLGKLATADEVSLHTYTYVREDILALYGFQSPEELQMFELLISVSGIGPKAGLAILSLADVKTLRSAITRDDASILTRVSGVGKKTAERVILELKSKIAKLPEAQEEEVSADADALEALSAMGYSTSEARDALKEISADVQDVGERVKAALKILGKK